MRAVTRRGSMLIYIDHWQRETSETSNELEVQFTCSLLAPQCDGSQNAYLDFPVVLDHFAGDSMGCGILLNAVSLAGGPFLD